MDKDKPNEKGVNFHLRIVTFTQNRFKNVHRPCKSKMGLNKISMANTKYSSSLLGYFPVCAHSCTNICSVLKRSFCKVIIIGTCLLIIIFYSGHKFSKITHLTAAVTKAYYARSVGSSVFLVDTPTCKIAEMIPFDPSISEFLSPDGGYPFDCIGSRKWWTYMNGTVLTVNVSSVRESGYSMDSIYCCYRIIERVEQPTYEYDMNADNYIRYSDKCFPIKNNTVRIDAEFIRVHCVSKQYPFFNDGVYRDFFAIAQPHADRLVSRKLSEWNRTTSSTPPNVVIIGLDNNSRMNSHRYLSKTLKLLQNLGAIEMQGYTKTAENTYPNSVTFLTGYTPKQFETMCYQSEDIKFDDCPFIWKDFDTKDYITVNAEDAAYLGGFNYHRTGFVRKPTDFYLRPLMLAVMFHLPRRNFYHTDCIGRQMTEELTLNYILDIIRLAKSNSAPVFVHNWLTSLGHHNYNNVKFGDTHIASYIESLVQMSNDNTIFFFMSDHGQRYGPIRETTSGWYEDKLPTQWVYLPKHLRESHPDWLRNLRINSNRLTSHFDVFHTMRHVLKAFSKQGESDTWGHETVYKFGQSLFTEVPENRTCEEAGITVNYCACSSPTPLPITDPKVIKAGEASVMHLKASIPLEKCAEPTLKKILTAGFLNLSGKPVYLLTFVTDPGDFMFEVNVEMNENSGEYFIGTDLLRMNKISRPADCVNDPLLERYCYCL